MHATQLIGLVLNFAVAYRLCSSPLVAIVCGCGVYVIVLSDTAPLRRSATPVGVAARESL